MSSSGTHPFAPDDHGPGPWLLLNHLGGRPYASLCTRRPEAGHPLPWVPPANTNGWDLMPDSGCWGPPHIPCWVAPVKARPSTDLTSILHPSVSSKAQQLSPGRKAPADGWPGPWGQVSAGVRMEGRVSPTLGLLLSCNSRQGLGRLAHPSASDPAWGLLQLGV